MMSKATTETAASETQPDGQESASLDAILDEFDEEVKPEETQKESGQDVNEILDYVRNQQKREAMEQTTTDINAAVDTVLDGVNLGLPDDLAKDVVEGLLYKQVENDKRLLGVFVNRRQNPSAWKSVLNHIKQDIQSRYNVDTKTTQDWNALESAVRSSQTSNATESQPDVSNMSDNDFMKLKMKLSREARLKE